MKIVLLSMMASVGFLYGGADWPVDQLPKNYIDLKIREADEISWLSPTYEKEREYSLVRIPAAKAGELAKFFLDAKPSNRVDTLLMDGEGRKDNGYLIFRKGGEVVDAFQIEPSATDRKSVRWCELLVEENGIKVVMRRGGLGQALVFASDYRDKLLEAVGGAGAVETERFKVYVCKDNKLN